MRKNLFIFFILSVPFIFTQCNFAERQKKKIQEDVAEKIISQQLEKHKQNLENGAGTIEGQMKITFDAINKQCPVMVDEITRLDSCTYEANTKKAQYFYTITDLSTLDPKTFKTQIEDILKENVKTNKDVAAFRMFKITIVYHYVDSKGKEITTVTITPDDYKE